MLVNPRALIPLFPENSPRRLLYVWRRDATTYMSGDTLRLALPLPLATDESEGTTLYRELRKPLLRYLVGLGLSSDESQDIVQEAFLSLHRHLSAGGSKENIRGWLFRVAHNRARNQQNRSERRLSAPLDSEADSVADKATPESAVLKKEKLRKLASAMRELTEPERHCLLLRASGLRYREIAGVLGIPNSTVADAVERAIRKLAERCNV